MNTKLTDVPSSGSGRNLVILGGGYAGVLAALRLAGKTRGTKTDITLVNGSETFTERIRLHQLAVGKRLPMVSIPRLLKGTGVQFVQGWVTQIDADDQTVEVQQAGDPSSYDGVAAVQDSGAGNCLSYDTLIYALGSSIDLESVAGVARKYDRRIYGDQRATVGHSKEQWHPLYRLEFCYSGWTDYKRLGGAESR